ncbi:MAG: GTPase [Thermoplasmata archaeon]|nr:MAG: GTPase [Thermoplasmata archaeon]
MFIIPRIMTADELLDMAFGRAKKIRDRDKKIMTMNKIKAVKKGLHDALKNYVRAFPSFDNLHPFHYELLDLLIGINEMKKALASLEWAKRKIDNIANYGIKRIRKEENYAEIIKAVYGRISSIVYEIDDSLKFLGDARKKLGKIPSISPNVPTIIIAGYPNVGKSSLLSLLSTARPKIASYPFTTKGIIVGHFYIERNHDRKKVQVMEVPGLLDRPDKDRNEIEKQGIIALRYLPSLIIFLIDASFHCGYSLENQLHLLEEIKKFFDVDIIIVENKADISKGKTSYFKISCKTGEGIEELREEIKKRLS